MATLTRRAKHVKPAPQQKLLATTWTLGAHMGRSALRTSLASSEIPIEGLNPRTPGILSVCVCLKTLNCDSKVWTSKASKPLLYK